MPYATPGSPIVQEFVLLSSAARTATTIAAAQSNLYHRGVLVYLRISAASGTGGLQVRIQGIDPASAFASSMNSAPTAVVATGVFTYMLYPGISGGTLNQATSGVLPANWKVTVTHGDSSSYTYSVYCSLLV